MKKLRVWWIPQVPMDKPFYYPVKDVEQAKYTLRLLAEYDCFEFNNNIKPDYSNAGGLEVEDDREGWVCWFNDQGDDIDEVMRRYLEIRRAMPGRALVEVEVRERGAVAFELEDGWQVLLGSDEISQRLKRAVIVINRLERMGIEPENTKIDARYTDGVAINGPIPTTDQLLTQRENTRKGEEL